MRWFWFLCLTAAAVSDIKERAVSDRLLVICGIVGGIAGWQSGLSRHLAGVLAGMIILAIGRVTRGAIGNGDGWFIIASAGYLNTEEMLTLLLMSFTISWIWSIGLVLYGVWSGGGMSKATLPFLACLWPAGVWMLMV